MGESGSGVFHNLDADDPEAVATEIESLCLQCRKNGTTRLLLTKIPFYKEVVIMSFMCDNCGWQNNELQPAASIQPTGVRYQLTVEAKEDLNRQVVKTKDATVTIPEVDLEIPAKSQEGLITTVEGLLQRTLVGLESSLSACTPEVAQKISDFVAKLRKLLALESPFQLILDDPSGNSFLENPNAPSPDPRMNLSRYQRSATQDERLGVIPVQDPEPTENQDEDPNSDVLEFPTNCSECQAPCDTRMKVTQVPHFKEVVIMATTCERCGHRTNEVKAGGGVEPRGVRFTLRVSQPWDLTRDVLKSETCSVEIPELELEAGAGIMSGRFTTVEGLLQEVHSQLAKDNPFFQGDSAPTLQRERMGALVSKLSAAASGKLPVTLVLDDPCGNSYVQNLCAPDPDPALQVEHYQRTFEQDDALGLNDINTDHYQPVPLDNSGDNAGTHS